MRRAKFDNEKLLSVATIGFILMSVLAINHVSAVSAVSVSPTYSTVQVGEQFRVNITLDYAENLYGFEVWLGFDNSRLNATAIDYMGYLNEPTMIWNQKVNNTGGYAALAVSSRYPATGKTGGSPPPLASVRFKCIGTGISPLHLYKTILSDDEAKPITHQTFDGQVNCTPSLTYDDVVFDSSFEMGNLINVQFQDGNASGYRYYTAEVNYSTVSFPDKHWWFYFSMQNTTGKIIKVELKNLAEPDFTGLPSPGFPRWPDIEPVYSYDNENWSRVPLGNVQCGNNETRNFNITLSPSEDKVWLAPIPPYTVTMRDQLFASYASSLYLDITSLGITPLGQNLTIATITNPSVPDDDKFIIYIIAQQHSGETVTSFVAEGMIRFLLNESDSTAAAIRRSYIFKIVPIVNVEGVYYGISRYTPFRAGTQYDMNRAWDDALATMLATCPEVRWIFDDINASKPDAFIDLHSEVNGESGSQTSIDCFFLHDGLYDTVMVNFLNNVSRGYDGTKDYWPETGSRSATGSQMAAVNVRTRLGIHPSVDLEHPHDNLRNTTAHPVDHNPQTIDDWKDWGKRTILGIFDYFGEVVLPNNPPSIDSFTPIDTTPEVDEGESLEFTHTSSDPDNDPLTYLWLLDSVEQATTQNWTYSPGYDDAGIHNVTLIVSDGELFASQTWIVTVVDVNRPPTIDSYYPLMDSSISEGESQEFNITYSDPDGDPVSVQWYLDGSPTVTTDSYTFAASHGSAGIYNVTVVVSDGLAQASHEWTLTVRMLVMIEEVTPCNAVGTPKDNFKRGTLAYFKVVVNNTGLEPVNVLITVNIYDSVGVTIGVASFQGPIMPGISTLILGLPIPNTAHLGQATVYASAFTDWVHNGGVPFCPEVSETFEITE